MSDATQIRETCAALLSAGFPIVTMRAGSSQHFLVESQDPLFVERCEKLFTSVVEFKKKTHPESVPQIWTSSLISTIYDYAQKHHLQVIFQTVSKAAIGTDGQNTVWISIGVGSTFNESSLLYTLDHEVGHLRDKQLLLTYFPTLHDYFLQQPFPDNGYLELCNDYLELFIRNMSPSEKNKFQKSFRDFFGDFRSMDRTRLSAIVRVLGELLRFGEEVHDTRFSDAKLNRPDHYLKKGFVVHSAGASGEMADIGNGLDVTTSIFAAEIQEAHLWDSLKQREDTDPEAIKYITQHQKVVDFLRNCIRAASRYYPSTL